jgi:hypothetical protein
LQQRRGTGGEFGVLVGDGRQHLLQRLPFLGLRRTTEQFGQGLLGAVSASG